MGIQEGFDITLKGQAQQWPGSECSSLTLHIQSLLQHPLYTRGASPTSVSSASPCTAVTCLWRCSGTEAQPGPDTPTLVCYLPGPLGTWW